MHIALDKCLDSWVEKTFRPKLLFWMKELDKFAGKIALSIIWEARRQRQQSAGDQFY